jgi:hypothetical protein
LTETADVAVTARPYRERMLGQTTIQLAELRRAELLAEATSHRLARNRTRTTSAFAATLLAALPRRRRASVVDRDVDVAAACCVAA